MYRSLAVCALMWMIALPSRADTVDFTREPISAGGAHTCGIKADGSAWCFGRNYRGQLGDGTTTDRSTPTAVQGGNGTWQSISAGDAHTCGIKTDGSAWCFGYNEDGQLGDGIGIDRWTPTAVQGGLTWQSISAGYTNTCGITTDGSAWCFGDNRYGQLGDGTTTDRWTPTAVQGGLTWQSISAGYANTCGIRTDGRAWCFGSNYRGQLGDGTTTDRSTPTAAQGGLTWQSISAGFFHTCGITTDGLAWCFGGNGIGQLGDGTRTDRSAPTAVQGGLTWQSISAGGGKTCGIKTDGSAWCFGGNNMGRLGDGTTTDRSTPTAVQGGNGTWQSISAGDAHTCGIKTDGSAWCFGENEDGQLGDGTKTDRWTPTAVQGGNDFGQRPVPANDQDSKEGDDVPLGAIIGGVIGGLVVVAVVITVTILLRKKQRQQPRQNALPLAATSDGEDEEAATRSIASAKPPTRPNIDSKLMVFTSPVSTGASTNPNTTRQTSVASHKLVPLTPTATSVLEPEMRTASRRDQQPASAPSLAAQESLLSNVTSKDEAATLSNATTLNQSMASTVSGLQSGGTGSTSASMREAAAFIKTFDQGEFVLGACIGRGSFGKVFKATWRRTDVALKVLAGDNGALELSDADIEALGWDLQKESTLMAKLRHPNIVQFLGICLSPPCLVTEYCARGSLTTLLREARTSPAKAAELTWSRRLHLLGGAARGVLYLHDNQPHAVLHRDLKSPNVLVTTEWNAKVCDFGLSVVLEEYHSRSTAGGMASNPRWLAPEMLGAKRFTPACDVYSFGVVMWEVLTWEIPWRSVNEFAIIGCVLQGQRPELPTDIPGPAPSAEVLSGYVELLQRCWHQDPDQRPGFGEVVDVLERLKEVCMEG